MADTRTKRLDAPNLFPQPSRKKHGTLFLQKYLADEANRLPIDPAELERVTAALKQWADAALAGHLQKKETALDGEFLELIFGKALGYKSVVESPNDFHREKNPTVAGAGFADGALGLFASGKAVAPAVIIEVKGAETDLDRDKVNGRTAVQQCWDYLNQLPDTPWGIVSNYVTIRLYHKSNPARAYEEFTVNDFLDPVRVRQFHYVFEKNGLIGNRVGTKPDASRATKLLRKTATQQRDIGDKLYAYYADQRDHLIDELMTAKGLSQDDAIHAAQRLLDRIIFMAFCENRGLLPDRLIESTWKNVAPLARATNPRWRNFLDAFHAIDKGHASLDLPTGYNGGLFRHDPLVDELDLGDEWADVFREIGGYDFREEGEVNVDVLGHLFERSITELEKRRVAGLFGHVAAGPGAAEMPKSAERKRFGVYYTPPQFTRLIVEQTLGTLITERIESLPDVRARIPALRQLKVVDPACGSGAFLIAAYERLEDAYDEIARELRKAGHVQEALNLANAYPDYVLSEQIYGVDLSAESVEITQLALWIRSARRGRPLTDLSKNIRRGNSLVRDKAVHPEAFDWHAAFPQVFGKGGFDVVIGNPPWEQVMLHEREFFSLTAPDIASAVTGAERKAAITKLEAKSPAVFARYRVAKDSAEATMRYLRECGHYPLSGKGLTNTYTVFSELSTQLIGPEGLIGLLVPSAIAFDHTTKELFIAFLERRRLTALYDFENKEGIFEDVHRSFKFCMLFLTGVARTVGAADFCFYAHSVDDLSDRTRHVTLSDRDIRLINPNTRTCPIFRTARDGIITRTIYSQVPVLIDRSRKVGGNTWSLTLSQGIFNQTTHSKLFQSPSDLETSGYILSGTSFTSGDSEFLPLYEAKMFRQFDHRHGSVFIRKENWLLQGQTHETTLVEHQNPEFSALPRWWVARADVLKRLRTAAVPAFLAFRRIARATDHRTMIAAFIPFSGVANTAPICTFPETMSYRRQACLLGNFNSLPFDFITRQKVGHIDLNSFIVEQLPAIPPDAYDDPCPWEVSRTLEDWVAERVLKLTCTADDMRPLAAAAGFAAGVHKWKDDDRARLRAELDAAYFRLYQIPRADVEYILGTFQGIRNEDESCNGSGLTRSLILEALTLFGG